MRIERARQIKDEANVNAARLKERLVRDGHELNQAVRDSIAKQYWEAARAVRAIEDWLEEREISDIEG